MNMYRVLSDTPHAHQQHCQEACVMTLVDRHLSSQTAEWGEASANIDVVYKFNWLCARAVMRRLV